MCRPQPGTPDHGAHVPERPPTNGVGDEGRLELSLERIQQLFNNWLLVKKSAASSLLFIPFSAWYVDQALEPTATDSVLLRAIPASVSGIKAVVRQELLHHRLPVDLLQLIYINGEWLYRFEKVVSIKWLVLLIGGKDPTFRRYVNGWLTREIARGGIERLFRYWILLKDDSPSRRR